MMNWFRKQKQKPAAEFIDSLHVVKFERDDVIIVTAKQMLTQNQKQDIEALFRLKLNIENKLVILDEGISIGIMRQ